MDEFDQIFYLETSTTTTTKKSNFFEKPPGWDKKPKKKYKLFEFFRIMHGCIMKDEMEPSDHRKFDTWMLDIKIILICTIFSATLFNVVATSSFASEKYTEESDERNSLLDQAIELIKQEPKVEPKKKIVIVKDSLVNIDSIAYVLKQSDSILNSLRHADDSLTQNK